MTNSQFTPATGPQQEVEYRDVVGFPGYRVGNDGTVWTCKKRKTGKGCGGQWETSTQWKLMIPMRNRRSGHMAINLFGGGEARQKFVHVLVLTAFVGPSPEGMQACHFPDRNPSNNRLENLRWDTPKANKDDSDKHGTLVRGSKVGTSKLKEEDAKMIRQMRNSGHKISHIAVAFNVSRRTVYDVLSRRRWNHVV